MRCWFCEVKRRGSNVYRSEWSQFRAEWTCREMFYEIFFLDRHWRISSVIFLHFHDIEPKHVSFHPHKTVEKSRLVTQSASVRVLDRQLQENGPLNQKCIWVKWPFKHPDARVFWRGAEKGLGGTRTLLYRLNTLHSLDKLACKALRCHDE